MEKQCSVRKIPVHILNECRKIFTILFLNKWSIYHKKMQIPMEADNCLHGKSKVKNDQETADSFVRHVRGRGISQFTVYQLASRGGGGVMICGVY